MSLRHALGTALLLLPLPALAAPGGAPAGQPVRTTLRYDEDWSANAGRDGIAGWKYLELPGSNDVHATFGLELRARYEGFENTDWGSKPDDGYLWLRAMPSVDLGAGPVRAFVQTIAGYARGVNGGNGPADQTGHDLLQAFADVRLALPGRGTITLRGGRELIGLGSERLVGLRYGPNIPQAFDGFRAIAETGPLRLDVFRLRPVQVGQRDFDDATSHTRLLSGVYATARLGGGGKRGVSSADIYWLGYRNSAARFGGIAGEERRDTYGLRLFGRRGRIAWNWEGMLQRGRFAGQRIRAWSIATETAVAFPDVPLQPRLRVRANIASGDRSIHDGTLGTFNAMFPKGRYFGELSPIGPRNIVHLNPSVDIRIAPKVTLDLSASAFWRQTIGDGIYDVPGQLLRAPGSSKARTIGQQAEVAVSWQPSPTLSFLASASVFTPGAFLRETGPAHRIGMAALEALFKF
ncbi:alginate export family protein [Novosphingobium sediminis]|uniref:Alginate export family protein n=1 Tax=Novosphingobium sediminis TaxID=707214 RepID=A0A512AN94_9SPHN|nr:alginate export family protein [Novosphingobium sediminis]GEO01151.1 alginate export family protein [Novosphingobium sediminis]